MPDRQQVELWRQDELRWNESVSMKADDVAVTQARLSVARDLGHGGSMSHYRIDPVGDGYRVTVEVNRPCPSPGEASFQPSRRTETLAKDGPQIRAFLRQLIDVFDVLNLSDLRPSHPFLHPTFHTFDFQVSNGAQHRFCYAIEGTTVLDERYERVLEAFYAFFQEN